MNNQNGCILSQKFMQWDWWGGRHHRVFTVIVFIILASLDNSARAVAPPLYAVMAHDLGVAEAALGIATGLNILVVAVTSVLWGYWGDRGSRKKLLLYGTIIWSVAMYLTGVAQTYTQYLIWQLVTAIGIGCIASVGFSVVTDLIPPGRRGLFMSFWGLSQANGGGLGALAGSLLGASNWRLPFIVIATAGVGFALLYVFTFEPRRGESEPELAKIFAKGQRYGRRIRKSDIKQILRIRSNIWILLQGLASTIAFGSLIWMPRLYIGKLQALGYDLETATIAGNILALTLQGGLYVAIIGGIWGDWWQRHNLAGRAWLCTIGTLGSIPFLILLFFLPLPEFLLPADANKAQLVWATILGVFTHRWVLLAWIVSLLGFGLLSLDVPNRSALLSDLNQPEHRGTVAGMNTLLAGVGLAAGNGLTGLAQTYLLTNFAAPTNYAVGLAVFQLFFIPAGLFYARMIRTTPHDIARARRTLTRRAEQSVTERITDEYIAVK